MQWWMWENMQLQLDQTKEAVSQFRYSRHSANAEIIYRKEMRKDTNDLANITAYEVTTQHRARKSYIYVSSGGP